MKIKPTVTSDPFIIKENNPTLSSVYLAVRLPIGSIHDPEGMLGLAHYLEHVVFKSTKRFPEINGVMKYAESLGASLNAYTTLDHTCFYIIGPSNKIDELVLLLSEVVFHSTFSEEAVTTERSIILQEYNTTLDDQWSTQLVLPLNQIRYGNTSTYNNVIGNTLTINNITYDALKETYNKFYVNGKFTILASGNISEDSYFVDLCREHLHKGDIIPNVCPLPPLDSPHYGENLIRHGTSEDNTKLWIDFEDVIVDNVRDYHIFSIINQYFGGGVSSRLWSVVREKHQLAYQVGSGFQDTMLDRPIGSMYVYAETNDADVHDLFDLVHKEYQSLVENGLTQKDFDDVISNAIGSFAVESDSRTYYAKECYKHYICYGQFYTNHEMLDELRKITLDDVNNTCKRLNPSKYSKGILYPKKKQE